jgi:hypothetical protein
MNIIANYDSSVTSLDPTTSAEFKSDVTTAITAFDNLITNPITITIDFGYNEVDGTPFTSGGESQTTNGIDESYATLYNQVKAVETTSAVQTAAVATLPTTDPTAGANFFIDPAEEKALGIIPNNTNLDGYVGVATDGLSDPGLFEHEISEVLGRFDDGGNGDYTLLDMFRYTAVSGSPTAPAAPGTAIGPREEPFVTGYDVNAQAYFSWDGAHVTLPYNSPANIAAHEDIADWSTLVPGDAFGEFAGATISNTDLQELNVLGYDIPSVTACYLKGTLIQTDHGEAAIEMLRIGDCVTTMSGASRPIRWIGRRSYSKSFAAGNQHVLPVRIRAGALGERMPRRDLWVSPEHAMWMSGMLIPASALVNGASITQEEPAEAVAYIHLEFDTHDVIYAEGAPSESFVDDESRGLFDNAAEYSALFPHARREPARFCAPRVEDGEELEAVRQRLRARAGVEMAAQGASPWRGNLDLVERGRIEGWARDESEPGRPVMLRILDNGLPIGCVPASRFRDDLPTAGIGDGRHAFSLSVVGGLAPEIDHLIEVRRADDGRALCGSPYVIKAATRAAAAYGR